jgi:hypothetical protein
MPEFEETDSQPNPDHTYTPSTDASKKPRTRRRSGGFKTEVSSSGTAGMGEVSAADALKGEKLSGSARPQERTERAERPKPARKPRAERPDTEDAPAKAPREPRKEREERVTNPQPSEATLAAIKEVEATIAVRRAERDARRKEREKNRPAKSERKPEGRGNKPQPKGKGKGKPAKKGGLLAAITGFFGKLFGSEPEKKPADNRGYHIGGQKRQGGNRGRGGNRGGQNRQGGKRGGQNRRGGNRGGQGRRQGGNAKPHSAKSLSNES